MHAQRRAPKCMEIHGPFDFSTGTTNPETFPTDALAEAAAQLDGGHAQVEFLDAAE